jgi:CubicO group peptidase (beta-lactamase class C family)
LVAAPLDAVSADPLDDYMLAAIKSADLPGAAVAIVHGGRIVKMAGYGHADRERQAPTATDGVYKIGSVSKQFVASAIMLLASDGRLAVDDSIARFIPDVPDAWRAITIRHLLTHTAGLVRESPVFEPMKAVSDLTILRGAYGTPLLFPPGSKWAYSNTGYYALAVVIATASGKPWTQFVAERILAPARMTSTLPTDVVPTPPNRAVGYTGRNNAQPATDWLALRPSGAFFSTLGDLAKWDGVLYGDSVLSETIRQQMWAPVQLSDGTAHPYGFGWHTQTRAGRRVVWHGGGLPGYASYLARFLDDRVTVIVLANGDDADLIAIGNGLADAYFASLTEGAR